MTDAPGLRRPTTVPPAQDGAGPARRSRPRLAALDGLRLLAALLVALYHYTGYSPGVRGAWEAEPDTLFPRLHQVGQYGWLGVELFFMISGFVICMSCWGRSPGAFFKSRVIRLFPAYWAAIVITTLVVTLWPTVRNPRHWSDIMLNLSMMQEAIKAPHVDAVYWTLWNEALFYLLFSFLVWRGLTLRRTVIFGYGWLIASMLSVESGIPLLETLLQPVYAPYFVAGIALYLIHRFGPDLLLWGLLGLSFAMAQYWTYRQLLHIGKNKIGAELTPLVGATLVTAFFLILTVIALGYLARIQWRWLTTAGVLTYPFYLLHEYIGWTIIHAVRGWAPALVVLPAVIVVMLVAAYLLHRLIEKPLSRFLKVKLDEASAALGRGDRYGGRPATRPTPETEPPLAVAPEPAVVPAAPAPARIPAQRGATDPAQSDTLILPMYRPKD